MMMIKVKMTSVVLMIIVIIAVMIIDNNEKYNEGNDEPGSPQADVYSYPCRRKTSH